MRFKRGVKIDGLSPQLLLGLIVAESTHDDQGLDKRGPFEVTSINDGKHMPGSLHYSGRAADLRTAHLSGSEARGWAELLRLRLAGLGFDIVLESDHLHIEYDPKPRRSPARSIRLAAVVAALALGCATTEATCVNGRPVVKHRTVARVASAKVRCVPPDATDGTDRAQLVYVDHRPESGWVQGALGFAAGLASGLLRR